MQERIVFREMLSEIRALADGKGNYLTRNEVEDFFSNAHLDETQLEAVYEYLASQKIKVEGYTPKEKPPERETPAPAQKPREVDQEEQSLLDIYLEEIEAAKTVLPQEELELFHLAAGGDAMAKSRIVELFLKPVYELSATFVSHISQSDLIQEGNVAMLLALEEMPQMKDLEDYRAYLFQAIQEGMEEAAREQEDLTDLNKEIEEKVNHLNEAVKNLESDLNHKVSIEELSVYLEMPEEEIRDILRMAGDEMGIAQ